MRAAVVGLSLNASCDCVAQTPEAASGPPSGSVRSLNEVGAGRCRDVDLWAGYLARAELGRKVGFRRVGMRATGWKPIVRVPSSRLSRWGSKARLLVAVRPDRRAGGPPGGIEP
jgi:hypothetical protein